MGKTLFTIPAAERLKPRAVKALFRFGQHLDRKNDYQHIRREAKKELRSITRED